MFEAALVEPSNQAGKSGRVNRLHLQRVAQRTCLNPFLFFLSDFLVCWGSSGKADTAEGWGIFFRGVPRACPEDVTFGVASPPPSPVPGGAAGTSPKYRPGFSQPWLFINNKALFVPSFPGSFGALLEEYLLQLLIAACFGCPLHVGKGSVCFLMTH